MRLDCKTFKALGPLLLIGCGLPPAAVDATSAYLNDPAYARAEMTASLVNPGNGYSAVRLAHYASGQAGDWDRLPEWNPPAEAVEAAELDAPGGASPNQLSSRAAPLALPASIRSADDPALIALGRAAFDHYPTQLAQYLSVALTSRAAAARYGLLLDAAGRVGSLVRARMADGSGALALTCASCHTAGATEGGVSPGRPNARLDLGAAIVESQGIPASESQDPHAAWGPGRVDVTTEAGTEPARIPDLRPVRWLGYLQQDATLRARDLTTLAIRIETLIVTAGNAGRAAAADRRAGAGGLRRFARFVVALARRGRGAVAERRLRVRGPLRRVPRAAGVHGRAGAALGHRNRSGCWACPPSAGRGCIVSRRYTASGRRGPLLHDGTVPSVDAMFDPSRVTEAFAQKLHGAGSVPGHDYGLDLDRRGATRFDHLPSRSLNNPMHLWRTEERRCETSC